MLNIFSLIFKFFNTIKHLSALSRDIKDVLDTVRLSPISMPSTFSPPHEAPTLQLLPAPETYFLFRACGFVACTSHCTCIEVRTTYGSRFPPPTLRVPRTKVRAGTELRSSSTFTLRAISLYHHHLYPPSPDNF